MRHITKVKAQLSVSVSRKYLWPEFDSIAVGAFILQRSCFMSFQAQTRQICCALPACAKAVFSAVSVCISKCSNHFYFFCALFL